MSAIYRVPLPVLERIALEDMARRRGVPESELLASIVRDAVVKELAQEASERPRQRRAAPAPAVEEAVRP